MVRQSGVDFSPVKDARRGATSHGHHGLLRLLVAAFACGERALRGVESFADGLSKGALRTLGLRAAASDSTLYRQLAQQNVAGFALVLVAQVKEALLRKWIANDLFREGVVAIDGKSSWSGRVKAHPSCKAQQTESGPRHFLMAQRACLVSSSARPVVTQRFIGADAGEMDTFGATFAFLLRHFGRSFEVVTHDAGGVSRENARLVHEAQKTYLFAVKGSQPRLFEAARSRLGCKGMPGDAALTGEAATEERADGASIRREVMRCRVEADDPELEFPGARQLLRVRQTTTRTLPSGRSESAVEDRYFVANRIFAADDALKLARLHWGIENGPNWACDVVLGEDDGAPCETGNGVAVTSWLRLLAYNLLSIWRHKLPPVRDEIVAAWTRSVIALRLAWLAAKDPLATLA
jgi:hypothetical protein